MGRQAIDLTGQTFGRLRVLRRDGTYRTKRNYTFARWLCLCDPELGGCGRKTSVLGMNLKNGHTTSCGCYACEYQQSRGQKRKEYGHAGGASPSPTAESGKLERECKA